MLQASLKSRFWVAAVVVLSGTVLWGSTGKTGGVASPRRLTLESREQSIWRIPIHDSQFADVPHTAAPSRCERTRAPEALTTPDPLLDVISSELRVRVSFIVGTDGKVHSPLILESMGESSDRAVLAAVRTWRFRPAMCNGVPTETEGKIQFSNR